MRFFTIFFLFFLILSCQEEGKNPIDPELLPNLLIYNIRELYLCEGESGNSLKPVVKGQAPFQFSAFVQPANPAISINSEGVIQIASNSASGIFNINISVSNSLGSKVFDNAYKIVVNQLNPAGVSFEDDVVPLVEAKCSPCHTDNGSRDWTIYENAKNQIQNIINRTESGDMPLGRPKLSNAEIQIFKDWRDNCFLEY